MNPSRLQIAPQRHSALTLVPAPSRHQPQRDPLALWHLLSLDAPTVATLWTIFVARCAHISLPWEAPVAMFLAVWMLYATDRLLDARVLTLPSTNAADLEERHLFHHRHKRPFVVAILVCSVALAALLPNLIAAALRLYALLASLLFAYFFLIHIYPANLTRQNITPRLPKELAVGLFFPAAIFIPTVAHDAALRPMLLPGALLFAAVCTLNCLYLYAWEHPGPHNSAHWTTRFATRHLSTLSAVTAIVAVLIFLRSHAPHSIVFLTAASAVSALLLFLLDTQRHRFAPIHLRAAADLTLLTPLLLLPFVR